MQERSERTPLATLWRSVAIGLGVVVLLAAVVVMVAA
jgi:hypothetical protein